MGEPTKQTWVYIGRRRLQKGGLAHCYVPMDIEDGLLLGNERCYKQSLLNCAVGSVIEVTVDGSTCWSNQSRWLYLFKDADKVAQWQAEDHSDVIREKAMKLGANRKMNDAIAHALGPVREAMRRTDSMGRTAIKVMVLEYLEDWRRL